MSAIASTFDWTTLFGSSLKGKSGDISTNEALRGKTIGVYFSAHWCPPCRGFTPEFAEFYNTRKAKGDNDFEVVFASSDRDQAAFDEYFAEMPWLALPFGERELKAKLSQKFKVQGIPMLVVLSPDGTVITTKGREAVSSRPESFPWMPSTLAEDMGTEFQAKDGSVVTLDSLAGKYIAFYFSAHWCGPCRSFTPKLTKFYTDRKASGTDDFEVIFCSGDNSEEEFQDYYKEMPWLTLKLGDKRKDALEQRFEVEGIPTLVIISPDGKVVTTSAVERVSADPTGKDFPFNPLPVENLSNTMESYGQDLNSCPSFIAYVDSLDDADQAKVKASLTPIASRIIGSGEDPQMIFFISDRPSRIGDKVKELTKTNKISEPFVLILDLPDKGSYYTFEGSDLTDAAVLESFVQCALSKDASKKKSIKE